MCVLWPKCRGGDAWNLRAQLEALADSSRRKAGDLSSQRPMSQPGLFLSQGCWPWREEQQMARVGPCGSGAGSKRARGSPWPKGSNWTGVAPWPFLPSELLSCPHPEPRPVPCLLDLESASVKHLTPALLTSLHNCKGSPLLCCSLTVIHRSTRPLRTQIRNPQSRLSPTRGLSLAGPHARIALSGSFTRPSLSHCPSTTPPAQSPLPRHLLPFFQGVHHLLQFSHWPHLWCVSLARMPAL